jgi:hypothetical protein
MKHKAGSFTLIAFSAILAFASCSKFDASKKHESAAMAEDKESFGGEAPHAERRSDGKDVLTKTAAAAPTSDIDDGNGRNRETGETLGKVFAPTAGSERKLEYNISANYRVDKLKTARAVFNQWIPRYGFLLHESASASGSGHFNLQVRIRSSQLYAALQDLDAIGDLTSENISAIDHTENAFRQRLIAAREELRRKRRANANLQTGTAVKSWQATETLLSSSEDKLLATELEDWKIQDRVSWATVNINLTLPVSSATTPVAIPHFRNAFIGLLNVILQLLYISIYAIPLLLLTYLTYRIMRLRILPAVRRWVSPSQTPARK